MTRQVTDNLYIDLEYFTPEEYYTYEAEAELVVASAATFVCDINVTATVTFEAALASEFAQTADASRIREFDAGFTGAFSPTMTAVAIVNLGSAINIVVTMSTDFVRNRATDVALDTIANLSAQANRIQEFTSTLSSSSTVTASISRIKSFSSTQSSTASLTASTRLVTRFIGDPTVNSGTTFSTLAIDTSTKKFGAGSLRFNQKLAADNTLKGHLSFPDYAGFDTWKTIDFWIYMGARPTGGSGIIPILRKGAFNQANAETAWLVSAVGTSNVNKYYITVTGWDTSGNAVSLAGNATEGLFDANTWSHVRIVNNASASSLYINGVRLTNSQATGRNLADTFRSNTAPLLIGGGSSTESGTETVFAQYFLDEILITDQLLTDPSVSSFTMPSAPNVNSTDTDGLWHFDTDFRDDNLANVTFASALSATATQSADGIRIRGTAVALTSTASISAVGQITQTAQSSITAVADLSAQADVVVQVQADFSVQGFMVTAAGEIAPGVAGLSSSFALSCVNTRIITGESALTTTASLTADVQERDLASANLTSSFALTASLKGLIQNGRANLTSAFTQVANVSENPNPNDYVFDPTTRCIEQFVPGTLTYTIPEIGTQDFIVSFLVDYGAVTTGGPYDYPPSTDWLFLGSTNLIDIRNDATGGFTPPGLFDPGRALFFVGSTHYSTILPSNLSTGEYRVIIQRKNGLRYLTLPGTRTSAGTALIGQSWTTNYSGTTISIGDTSDGDGLGQWPFCLRDFYFEINGDRFYPPEIASADLRATFALDLPQGLIVKFGEASLTSTASQTANIARIRSSAVSLTSAATVSVTATNIKRATASLSATAQQTVNGTVVRNIDSALTSTVTMSVAESRIRSTSTNVTANFTQSVEVQRNRFADSALTVVAEQTVNNTRIRNVSTSFASIASQMAAVARVGDGFVAIDVNTSISIDARKTTDTPINFNAVSTLIAESRNIVFAEISLSSTAELSANVNRVKPVSADLTFTATMSVTARKVTDFVKDLNVTANIVADNTRLRTTGSNQNAVFTQIANNLRVRFGSSTQTATTTFFCTAFNLVQVQANLQANGFQLTAGRVIHLDPYYTYLIPEETRAYIITEESRFYQIEQETRTLKI